MILSANLLGSLAERIAAQRIDAPVGLQAEHLLNSPFLLVAISPLAGGNFAWDGTHSYGK